MTRCRLLAALLVAATAFAQEPAAVSGPTGASSPIDLPAQIPALAFTDLKAAVTAPAGWTPGTWGRVALGAAALVGLSMALDRPVDRAVRRSDLGSVDPWAKRLDTLGGTGTVVVAGGAYLGGLLADQPKVRAFGADAALSMLVGQVVLTLPAKFLFGRSRPLDDAGPYHFKPFGSGDSFPSGHATQAFSLATVISAYADSAWVSVAAYTGATLVGLARIEERQHFVSDVAAGAVIGTLSAKAVLLRHRTLRLGAHRPVDVSCAPVWQGSHPGLMVKLKF
jgi:hypothetical protein